jgi:predicted phosphodiesterase
MKTWLALLISLVLLNPLFAGKNAKGIVFLDSNKNGVMDKGEPGIPNVPVSNQIDVVLTDGNGEFSLPVTDRTIIFVSKPNNYQFPVNDINLPQFYYLHFPKGSPGELKFGGLKPTGDLPKKLYFPLHHESYDSKFTALITGDPQPATDQHVDYFRDDVLPDMHNVDAKFYLALGDIVWDNLALYERYNKIVGTLDLPAYNVHGNHDMDFDVPTDEYATETFRRIYGPEYYSFDYGEVHFIVLDDVRYNGWNKEENKRGGYIGEISERQLQWLENDLKYVPENKLVVLSKHIPLYTQPSRSKASNVTNRDKLFELLENRTKLLALSGHTHTTEVFAFDTTQGWHAPGEFWSVNPGAACGAWWSGPTDEFGLPLSYGMDGSPNGFYVFDFDGTDYRFRFQAAGEDETMQMRVLPMGKIVQDSLLTTPIIVNVFAGGKDTEVFLEIDNGARVKMTQKMVKDPFIVNYMKANRESMPGWLHSASVSTHLWFGDFSEDLDPGLHTLKITALDHQYKSYSHTQVIEIVK